MKVSIVVPAFNQQALLDRSLATLHVQRQHLHQCIVVDDGSYPMLSIPAWCDRVRIDRDPRHRGSSAAKNLGVTYATGTHLVFADSDILHMRDAMVSLKACMSKREDEGENRVLLDVWRAGLPEEYPDKYLDDIELLYDKCVSTELIPSDINEVRGFYEQNCGMIRADFFKELGGYDEKVFTNWGFNNQDLVLRVIKSGGRFSSAIPRSSNGRLLGCFHMFHDAPRDKSFAEKDFVAKYGKPFHIGMAAEVAAQCK